MKEGSCGDANETAHNVEIHVGFVPVEFAGIDAVV